MLIKKVKTRIYAAPAVKGLTGVMFNRYPQSLITSDR